MYSSAIKKLKQIPEVVESHYTTGNWAILIKILSKNNEDLMYLLNNDIQRIKGVSRTETFISLDQQINRQIIRCNIKGQSEFIVLIKSNN